MRNIQFDGWFWIYDADGRIYSSEAADYVPADDARLAEWTSDGTEPTPFSSEYELGATLYVHRLRPIPQPILDGYIDAQMADLSKQPDYPLWSSTYGGADAIRAVIVRTKP